MMRYSLEPRTRKHVKGYGFLSFARKYKKQLLDTELDALKTVSKKVVHKSAEATGEFLGNKITDAVAKLNNDKIVKPKQVTDENPRNVEEITIPPEKRRNIKRIKTSIIKMEHYQISKLLNDSTVLKFVTKQQIKVNDISSGQYSVNTNISFKTSMLRSDLCDYSDTYIVVKGTIDLVSANENDKAEKNIVFKNNAPFR